MGQIENKIYVTATKYETFMIRNIELYMGIWMLYWEIITRLNEVDSISRVKTSDSLSLWIEKLTTF